MVAGDIVNFLLPDCHNWAKFGVVHGGRITTDLGIGMSDWVVLWCKLLQH